jgi:hypothetical protein
MFRRNLLEAQEFRHRSRTEQDHIEYWGMDTADYKIGMLKKQKLYQQEGKKLISLYFSEKRNSKSPNTIFKMWKHFCEVRKNS